MAPSSKGRDLFIFFTILLNFAGALEITEVRGPTQLIQNGSDTLVSLDCKYELSAWESEGGLVVKWYFNHEPSPVYQWIPSQKPQDLGVLKGKLDLGKTVDEHEAKKHRALHIVRPTTELSGEYTCKVSTFESERELSQRLIIFVPEKSIVLTQSKSDDDNSVVIKCEAEGIFPEPTLRLFAGTEDDSKYEVEGVIRKMKVRDGGVFDITASKRLTDADLESPTIFDCELGINDTDYKRKKSLIYYPEGYTGSPLLDVTGGTTTPTSSTDDSDNDTWISAEQGTGTSSLPATVSTWCILTAIVFPILQHHQLQRHAIAGLPVLQ